MGTAVERSSSASSRDAPLPPGEFPSGGPASSSAWQHETSILLASRDGRSSPVPLPLLLPSSCASRSSAPLRAAPCGDPRGPSRADPGGPSRTGRTASRVGPSPSCAGCPPWKGAVTSCGSPWGGGGNSPSSAVRTPPTGASQAGCRGSRGPCWGACWKAWPFGPAHLPGAWRPCASPWGPQAYPGQVL